MLWGSLVFFLPLFIFVNSYFNKSCSRLLCLEKISFVLRLPCYHSHSTPQQLVAAEGSSGQQGALHSKEVVGNNVEQQIFSTTSTIPHKRAQEERPGESEEGVMAASSTAETTVQEQGSSGDGVGWGVQSLPGGPESA